MVTPVARAPAFLQYVLGSSPDETLFFLCPLVCSCIHPFVFWLRVVGFRSVLSVRLHSCFFSSFPLQLNGFSFQLGSNVNSTEVRGPPPLSHHRVITSVDPGGSPGIGSDDWVSDPGGQVMTGVGQPHLTVMTG